ncbi:hypothetical protein HO173_010412 [Letharia columbiana]|uniref:SnoaL-like domain-containing protein n=1 Tax=Letharia columbiana TaxID=112416 RepID=A0A8H6L0X7_9LECA|nr:uncharacterized protein HO173_010412 [Letharia columbiana]KAF6231451.1 hypothetical protein HO173_010412 [Letharia columbiana]
MHFSTVLPVALIALPTILASPTPHYYPTTPQAPFCPPKPATPSQQHAIFFDFINKLYTLEDPTTAYLTYVSPDYINHSPYAPQGRAAAIAFLNYLIPSVNRTIVHETFEGGIGFVHLNVAGGQMAVADVFRLDGTCVMEHWDVDQARPANATNPLALF